MTLLGYKLKQTQQLNQRLQQSLRVLQMSGIELEREVENWLSDNPLLERKDTDEFSDAEFSHYTAPARQIGGDEGEDMLSNIAGEQDFKQYLHAQVCEHPLSDQEAACVHILIDFLDEQGYLTDSIEDILDHTPLEWMLDEAMLKQALTALKKFDPAGVAAADLNESLILQIERSGECAAKTAALHIVRNALNSIDGNRSQTLARIKKRLPQTDSGTLEAALDLIASLNPFPAAGFASSTPTPYSDEALANLLAFRGMEVSRRTIAKYRESFEIPAAHKRKTAE
ncbi:TPA: RNA polymerase subunit sigma [Neisseria meningitidis]